MTEYAQASQVEATERGQKLASIDVKRGHWMGWSVTVGAIAGAVVCTFAGHTDVAFALIGVPVLTVAKAFIDSARGKS